MNKTAKSLCRQLIKDERGQVIPMLAALMLVAMFGLTALTIDLGRVYLSDRELQASTDAAALAGAEALPNNTYAIQATTYSGVAGSKNAYANLPGVTMVSGWPKVECLNTLTNQGISCLAPANGNAVQVKQTVKVPLIFAGVLGAPPVTLVTTATAASRGSALAPFNVAIVLDTTASMNDADGTPECSGTRLACALQGVQTLLSILSPCSASEGTCSVNANGVAKNAVDSVSLFTFPNITTATVANDTNCSGANPTIEPYTFPTNAPIANSGYVQAPFVSGKVSYSMTYQVTSFQSDYRTSDDPKTPLNPSSAVSKAAGAGNKGCPAMQAPGGDGTYYAGALYAAQAALAAQAAANPNSQNVMILLSDGDATAAQAKMASASQVPAGALYATASGTYPSWIKECQQAVTAAQYAAAHGTRVYAVAYSPEPTGCTSGDSLTPCQTMAAIASAPQYFYTDVNGSGSDKTCTSQNTGADLTSLKAIFNSIGADLSYARLIPDGTT